MPSPSGRLAALSLVLLASCSKERGQESASSAQSDVAMLVELVGKDVAEVERGLPEGAKKLEELLTKDFGAEDPKQHFPAVRTALLKMRQQVPDLGIAKSTFFALADAKGVAIRNDFEPDTMAGKDLVAGWPGLAPVTSGAPYATTNGRLSATPGPPDKEWVAAAPVKRADGTARGLLVTGWTYRRFAYHLQATLQREVQEQVMRKQGKMAILYVCLFDPDGVYCAASPGVAPVPEVNEKALRDAGLHGRTATGTASSPVRITERDFGWAAARAPKLGADVGVVVLRSND